MVNEFRKFHNLTSWQSPTHGNRPPVANAGPDQTVPADSDGFATVTLDGSATTDADGDPLLYWWELDGESFADGVKPSEQLCIGQHLIKLIIRDPADNISTDEVFITVTGDPTFIRAVKTVSCGNGGKRCQVPFFGRHGFRITLSRPNRLTVVATQRADP